jgi:dolichol kinase
VENLIIAIAVSLAAYLVWLSIREPAGQIASLLYKITVVLWKIIALLWKHFWDWLPFFIIVFLAIQLVEPIRNFVEPIRNFVEPIQNFVLSVFNSINQQFFPPQSR